jgi:hypothetical protein
MVTTEQLITVPKKHNIGCDTSTVGRQQKHNEDELVTVDVKEKVNGDTITETRMNSVLEKDEKDEADDNKTKFEENECVENVGTIMKTVSLQRKDETDCDEHSENGQHEYGQDLEKSISVPRKDDSRGYTAAENGQEYNVINPSPSKDEIDSDTAAETGEETIIVDGPKVEKLIAVARNDATVLDVASENVVPSNTEEKSVNVKRNGLDETSEEAGRLRGEINGQSHEMSKGTKARCRH